MQAIVKTDLMDLIQDELNTILIQASDMSEDKQERVLALLVSLRNVLELLEESCDGHALAQHHDPPGLRRPRRARRPGPQPPA